MTTGSLLLAAKRLMTNNLIKIKRLAVVIGRKLDMTYKEVQNHLEHIQRKLNSTQQRWRQSRTPTSRPLL